LGGWEVGRKSAESRLWRVGTWGICVLVDGVTAIHGYLAPRDVRPVGMGGVLKPTARDEWAARAELQNGQRERAGSVIIASLQIWHILVAKLRIHAKCGVWRWTGGRGTRENCRIGCRASSQRWCRQDDSKPVGMTQCGDQHTSSHKARFVAGVAVS